MARDLVRRNVVELAEVPAGRPGRKSKALTCEQVDAVLFGTTSDRLYPYIVVSLLTGARTEELRALRWEHVLLDGWPEARPPLPPYMEVWRSVREGGDTKTRSHGGLWRCRRAASMRFVDSVLNRQRIDWRPGRAGRNQVWCSPRGSAPRWTRPTCDETCAGLSRACPASTRLRGLLVSCGTRSSRSCRTPGYPSNRSGSWWGTAARQSPSWCTGTSCGR